MIYTILIKETKAEDSNLPPIFFNEECKYKLLLKKSDIQHFITALICLFITEALPNTESFYSFLIIRLLDFSTEWVSMWYY